ncbi:hypothetical protein J1N35_006556 [Gossypium stocksii]|uniref:Uncharacterized protein n=1 Tax=Gossypium stocksii TaxID=47602 RepID=A0A9D4AKE2_9ROSI|nr:hypothetical protein J1N35_006556 [Gossypium stocksii]
MAEEDIYKEDGTTDFRNKPAVKHKTGTWKACPHILEHDDIDNVGINSWTKTDMRRKQHLPSDKPLVPEEVSLVFHRSVRINFSSIGSIFRLTSVHLSLLRSLFGYKQRSDGVGGLGFQPLPWLLQLRASFRVRSCIETKDQEGVPLTRIFQVMAASVGKARVEVPNDKSLLYETTDEESTVRGSRKLDHTKQLSFFDKAAVVTSKDQIRGSINPWKLFTRTQIEELKSIIRLLPIWATGIIFSAVYSQMGTLFVLQGNTMELHMSPSFEIPSASLSLFDTISVIFWVPVCDCLIVPLSRKLTGHKNGFAQLQRMAIGLVLSVFAMLFAGTLELVRLRKVKEHNYYELKHIPMSIFWQVPQYFIIGCAEVFTFIGQLEFFYEQAPDAMRSLRSALSLTTAALGNYLSTFLVKIVADFSTRDGDYGWIPDNLNYGHLHYFFWLLAVLSVLNLGVYLMVARWYTFKKAPI